MCGIFGYVGKDNAARKIIAGLKRLEYRGYDSWGVAVIERTDDGQNKIVVHKKVGQIGNLDELNDFKNLPNSNMGIGHTRWATHGGVTFVNAHPHFSTDKSFVVAQNGIVENYQQLKKMLIDKGYKFKSQTDTEVIVRLIEDKLQTQKSLKQAVRKAFLQLEGRNTIILMTSDGQQVLAIRNGSPLVIGLGKDEYFFASDTLSFADKTNRAIFINNFDMVYYHNNKLDLIDVKSDRPLPIKIKKLADDDVDISKEGYEHFMLKEIVEQQHTIVSAVQYSPTELEPLLKAIQKAKTVYTIGAGTAGFAAGQIAYFLRKIAKIKAIELKSYEISSYQQLVNKNDLLIAVSQSGETADTLEAVEVFKERGAKIASIVNMLGSTLTRISDFAYFSRTGPEICVASTKAFTAQIAWGFVVAQALIGKYKSAQATILRISKQLAHYFTPSLFQNYKRLAKKMIGYEHFFILGRGQNYYIALEGALKIKEISYKHFEGFAAGELKHGVIALIEKNVPTFVIVDSAEKNNMLAAAAEVKARGAYVVGIADENNDLFDNFIPCVPSSDFDSLTNVIPFQLISYYMALQLKRNPDKPRNLAKSVTVK